MNRLAKLAALVSLVLAVVFALRPDAPEVDEAAPEPAPRVERGSYTELPAMGAAVDEPEAEQTRRVRYQLEYAFETTLDRGEGPTGSLTGVWTVEGRGDDRVAATLTGVETEGHPMLADVSDLKGGIEMVARADGPLAGIGFAPRMPIDARRLYTVLATAFWFGGAEDADAWTRDEEDAIGTFFADYARRGDTVVRTVDAFSALRGPGGLTALGADQVETGGDTRYTFDARGLKSVEVNTRMVFDMGEGTPRVETIIEARLRRIDQTTVTRGPARMAIQAIGNQVDYATERAVLDDAKVAGADAAEMLRELDRVTALDPDHEDTSKWRAVTLQRMAALIRVDPLAAERFADAVRGDIEATDRNSLLLGALGSSRSVDGTNALAGLLDDTLDFDTEQAVMTHLALADVPSADAMDALEGALDGDNPDAAAAAMGAQAGKLAEGGPEAEQTAEDAIDLLIERYNASVTREEQVAALMALGNTGSPRVLPILTSNLVAHDPGVSSTAIFGLRFIPDAQADVLLGALVARGGTHAVSAAQAAAYRDAGLWTPRLEAAREAFADHAPLVRAIDAALGQLASQG